VNEHGQEQPGTPGVDPATTDPPPAIGPPGAAAADPASPSTAPTGDEHAAAPALDPGQDPELRSPATVTSPDTPTADAEGEGYVSAKPLLLIGAAGDDVAELGWLLAGHGFANAISEGQAAAPPILDDALMRVVVDFQQKNGINPWEAEAPAAPIITQAHMGIVDARTWEALLGYRPAVTPTGKPAEGEGVTA
jgi:hypothetical protein